MIQRAFLAIGLQANGRNASRRSSGMASAAGSVQLRDLVSQVVMTSRSLRWMLSESSAFCLTGSSRERHVLPLVVCVSQSSGVAMCA